MAACDSLQHMFDTPLTSEPSLSSSWNPQLGRPSPSPVPRSSSVTELFGELHFEESSPPIPSPSSNSERKIDEVEKKGSGYDGPRHRSGGSLQLCTEGLGFESLGDVEDVTNEEPKGGNDGTAMVGHERVDGGGGGGGGGGGYYCFWGGRNRGTGPMLRRWRSTVVTRRERMGGGGGGGGGSCFPPPISIVNRPWVSLRGYRCDGRFMLKEVTVPAQEFLHASREGGRLRLDFVQGVQEDEDDDDEEDDVDGDENNDVGEDDDDMNEDEVIEDDNEVEDEGDVGKN